jgi:opacity protein-like surface antigen
MLSWPNAYADLGTFAGFTPYVGAGAGVTLLLEAVQQRLGVSVAGNVCGASTDRTRIGDR